MPTKIASSSNGRTADSDSVNLGSSPGEAANKKASLCGRFFYWLITYGEEPSGSKLIERFNARWDDEVAKAIRGLERMREMRSASARALSKVKQPIKWAP